MFSILRDQPFCLFCAVMSQDLIKLVYIFEVFHDKPEVLLWFPSSSLYCVLLPISWRLQVSVW